MCRTFPKKIILAASGALSKTRPVICGERELVAQLVWRRKSGRAKQGFVASNIGACDDFQGFVWAAVRGGVKAKKMERKVHRWGRVRVHPCYRHESAGDSLKLCPCRAHVGLSTWPGLASAPETAPPFTLVLLQRPLISGRRILYPIPLSPPTIILQDQHYE
jgi:hypothetical protein